MNKDKILHVAEVDEQYLSQMKNSFVSDKEKEFFDTMDYKMHNEPAWANDLILHETNNPDGLYLIRVYDSEFIIGRHVGDVFAEEVHTMSFSEAMNINLKGSGLLNWDDSLLEWLRQHNYAGVEYDHNFDIQ